MIRQRGALSTRGLRRFGGSCRRTGGADCAKSLVRLVQLCGVPAGGSLSVRAVRSMIRPGPVKGRAAPPAPGRITMPHLTKDVHGPWRERPVHAASAPQAPTRPEAEGEPAADTRDDPTPGRCRAAPGPGRGQSSPAASPSHPAQAASARRPARNVDRLRTRNWPPPVPSTPLHSGAVSRSRPAPAALASTACEASTCLHRRRRAHPAPPEPRSRRRARSRNGRTHKIHTPSREPR